jgi:hypothetical protein
MIEYARKIEERIKTELGSMPENMVLEDCVHSVKFYQFLKSIGIKHSERSVCDNLPSYSSKNYTEVFQNERAMLIELKYLKNLIDEQGDDVSSDDYRNSIERINDINTSMPKNRFRFTNDNELDVLIVERVVDSFDVERILPKLILICDCVAFNNKDIDEYLITAGDADLFLPCYTQIEDVIIEEYSINSSEHDYDITHPVLMRLLKRSDC